MCTRIFDANYTGWIRDVQVLSSLSHVHFNFDGFIEIEMFSIRLPASWMKRRVYPTWQHALYRNRIDEKQQQEEKKTKVLRPNW